MKLALASVCAGLAAWCSLGVVGFVDSGSTIAHVGILPRWWWLPVLIAAVFSVARVTRLSGKQTEPLFGSAVLLLPWLPFPLPAASMLWTGPLTVVIWTIVIGAVALARWSPPSNRWLTDGWRAPVLAGCMALALYGASARWLAPILPDGDSPHYLILAQSLIRDGDIQIENNHRRGDYLEYSLLAAQPDYLRRGVNGQIYSIHAPGLPAVIAPSMWLAGYPGTVAFLGLVAAITTGLVWWLAHLLTEDAGAAWFAWACVSLTVPFFFQATEVFPDGFAATCVLIGTLPLWLAQRDERLRRPRRHWNSAWWMAGAALALLPWLQTRLAAVAAVAAVLLLPRMRSRRELVAFTVLPAVSASAWFTFFWVVYGTPNPAAPYGPLTQSSVSNMSHGLPGVLFDQQFGLFSNAPVWAVVLAGCLVAAARLRRSSLEVLALTVPYTVSVAMYQHWWGGASAPARLLTPLVPVLGLEVARVWARSRAATRALSVVVLGFSVFLTVLLCVPERGGLLINFRDGIALWVEWVQDVLALSRTLPSLFVDTPRAAVFKAVVWGATGLAMWAALWLTIPRTRTGQNADGRPRVSWLAVWTLAVLPMIAVTIIWQTDRVAPITAARSQTGLLRRLSSGDVMAFDFGVMRSTTASALRSRLAIRSDDQRPRSSPSHILSAQAVSPGTYRVQVDARATPADGMLTLRIGDTTLPFARWPAAQSVEHAGGDLTVDIPVTLRSLVVEADAAALRWARSASLRQTAPPDSRDARGPAARRGAHYLSADVFFLDDNAYPEPTGFWIAGGRLAHTVIAHGGEELRIFLRNSPVDNVVTLDLDDEHMELTMAPREEREVAIARTRSGSFSTLRVAARSGFRPSQVEPGNKDLRYLGCWIEPR